MRSLFQLVDRGGVRRRNMWYLWCERLEVRDETVRETCRADVDDAAYVTPHGPCVFVWGFDHILTDRLLHFLTLCFIPSINQSSSDLYLQPPNSIQAIPQSCSAGVSSLHVGRRMWDIGPELIHPSPYGRRIQRRLQPSQQWRPKHWFLWTWGRSWSCCFWCFQILRGSTTQRGYVYVSLFIASWMPLC